MRNLFESVLDTTLGTADMAVSEEWFKLYTKGNYKKTLRKDNTLKITGRMVIKGAPNLPSWLNISQFDGDLDIIDCQWTSLEGLFNMPECFILEGSMTITSCPKLNSLKGMPWKIHGNLEISNCKALKSVEGISMVRGDMTVIKCGKKFVQYRDFPHIEYDHLFCSEEDIEANIKESLQDPLLLRIWELAKNEKNLWGEPMFKKLESVIGYTELRYDKLTPEYRQCFRRDQIPSKVCQRMIKDVIYKQASHSFIVLMDDDGNPYAIITGGRTFTRFYKPKDADSYRNPTVNWKNGHYKYQALQQLLTDVLIGSIWIYLYDPRAEGIAAWDLSHQRQQAREGVVYNTETYYKEIARENRERYRKYADKVRAAKDDKVDEIGAWVEKLCNRFGAFARAMTSSNPPCDKYQFSSIARKMRGDREWHSARSPKDSGFRGVEGLLQTFTKYMDAFLDMKSGGSYSFQAQDKKRYETELNEIIQELDSDLRVYGF